jgi:hypothetical protein
VIGYELDTSTSAELVRFVRALGQHRYVASRLHLIHAFAFDAAATDESEPALAEGAAWARRCIESGVIDLDSKDERLYRRATDAELVSVLEAFWSGGRETRAHARLRERLTSIDALPDAVALSAPPFDESHEEDMFPVLVDAGWELLPIAHLDLDRHRGAIQAFDDFEVAKFEEQSAVPSVPTLHEMPLLGPVELLAACDADALRAPFVLWQQGHESYLDYVLRGVLRASKLA